MRFKPSVLLPVALLALGSLSACSNEGDDDDDNPRADAGTNTDGGTNTDAGTNNGADSGTYPFPDGGTDPGTSPTAACPAGALFCDDFSGASSGWTPIEKNARVTVEGGRLHVLTQNGIAENPGGNQALGQWMRPMPQFGTQLFVRAHVYMTALPGAFGQMGTFFVLANFGSDFGGFELQAIQDSGFALDDWTGRPGQGWNRQGPPVNLGLSAGRWMCLEWEVRRASASATHGLSRVYVDGVLAHEFNPQRDTEPDGIGMRNFDHVLLGYGFVHPQASASGSETWIDNFAVGTQRMGCQ